MKKSVVISALLYYAGWLGAILGAAQGEPLVGSLTVMAILLIGLIQGGATGDWLCRFGALAGVGIRNPAPGNAMGRLFTGGEESLGVESSHLDAAPVATVDAHPR